MPLVMMIAVGRPHYQLYNLVGSKEERRGRGQPALQC